MLVEVAGGLYANSLTLLADAGHMFLDATALGLSWVALRLSQRSGDAKLSYGYHRWQVLAAFVNGLMLLAMVAFIVLEAWERLQAPQTMLPLPALAVAVIGLLVNALAFRWLHGGEANAAVASAAWHVLGDILGSVAAITAALAVWLGGWSWADPLLAAVVAMILLHGAWRVLRDSGHILLEGVPSHLDLDDIARTLTARVTGVYDVHHLHAWALTAEKPLLTLHATVRDRADISQVVTDIKTVLLDEYGIDHSTVQVEQGEDCPDDDHRRPS